MCVCTYISTYIIHSLERYTYQNDLRNYLGGVEKGQGQTSESLIFNFLNLCVIEIYIYIYIKIYFILIKNIFIKN